jgi:hypothetical protein
MAGKNSKKCEILQRRENVAKRYVKGFSMRQIAFEMEESLTTVFRDIKAVQGDWQENARRSISEHKAKELARLDNLEFHAWQCLAMSQGDVVVTTHRGKGKAAAAPAACPKCSAAMAGAMTCPKCGFVCPTAGTEVTRQEVKKKSAGDARFMKIILECIRQRCVILGLQSAIPQAGTDFGPIIGIEVALPESEPVEVMESAEAPA